MTKFFGEDAKIKAKMKIMRASTKQNWNFLKNELLFAAALHGGEIKLLYNFITSDFRVLSHSEEVTNKRINITNTHYWKTKREEACAEIYIGTKERDFLGTCKDKSLVDLNLEKLLMGLYAELCNDIATKWDDVFSKITTKITPFSIKNGETNEYRTKDTNIRC